MAIPNSKKRSAPSGSLSSSAKKPKSGGRTRQVEPREEPKRKKAITSRKTPQDQEEDSLEGGDSDWEDDGEGYDEVPMEDEEAEEEEENAGGDASMTEEAAPTKAKDLDAMREARLAQKNERIVRRATKSGADILAVGKTLWAKLNLHSATAAERAEVLKELMDLLRGKMATLASKHDGVRILQSIVKYGSKSDREAVAIELEPKVRELIVGKYGRFVVGKLIRFCPSQRTKLFTNLAPLVPRLLTSPHASPILEDAFALYSTAKERNILLKPFYGKEVSLFYTDSDGKGIAGFLESATEEAKGRLVLGLNNSLKNILNSSKAPLQNVLLHRLIYEYILTFSSLANEETRAEKRKELMELCEEHVAEFCHTRDGSSVVRDLLAHGNAKDRKALIKSLKPHIVSMCEDAEAQTVLFTIFDCVDDTKLVGKSVIGEMFPSMLEILQSKTGRRVPLYVLVPRVTRYFIPSTLAQLSSTDAAVALTSKKATPVRRSELKKAISKCLLETVRDNVDVLIREPGSCLVVGEILLYGDDDIKLSIIPSLLTPITSPYKPTFAPSPNPETAHPIDLSYCARLYKTLFAGGHFNSKATPPAVEVVDQKFAFEFSKQFLSVTKGGLLLDFASGNGAFVVAELIEALKGDAESKKVLKGIFGKEGKKKVEEGLGKGKEVLLSKIEEL